MATTFRVAGMQDLLYEVIQVPQATMTKYVNLKSPQEPKYQQQWFDAYYNDTVSAASAIIVSQHRAR